MLNAERRHAAELETTTELFVVTAHEQIVIAVPAQAVARLLLAEEVTSSQTGLLHVDGRAYAVWDLGVLLHMAPANVACLLLDVPRRPSAGHDAELVPIALRTGACLCVQTIAARTPIPAGMFPGRPGALVAAFSTGLLSRPAPALVGFTFDPTQAFTDAELAESQARLRRAKAGHA